MSGTAIIILVRGDLPLLGSMCYCPDLIADLVVRDVFLGMHDCSHSNGEGGVKKMMMRLRGRQDQSRMKCGSQAISVRRLSMSSLVYRRRPASHTRKSGEIGGGRVRVRGPAEAETRGRHLCAEKRNHRGRPGLDPVCWSRCRSCMPASNPCWSGTRGLSC